VICRGVIGLVTQQDRCWFDDTVFNNIRYGSPQATARRVRRRSDSRPTPTASIEEQLDDGNETVVRPGAAIGCRAANGSASPWPARSCAIRTSCSWTKHQPRSTWKASS